ncbi:MAG: sensor histidine kinase [Candidatus Xenobia bacterium]
MPVRMRLRAQIAGILFLLITLSMVLVGYFNVTILGEILLSSTQAQGRAVADALAASLASGAPPEGFTARYVDRWSGDVKGPTTREVHIYGRDGKLLTGWARGLNPHEALAAQHVAEVLATHQSWGALWTERGQLDSLGPTYHQYNYEQVSPCMSGDTLLGVLHVSLDVADLQRRYQVVLWGNVILVFIFLVTAYIAISVWSDHAINRPLNFILQAQEQLGKGDFSARVDLETLPSSNEILTISSSFNRMTTDISRFRAELLEKTRRLMTLNEQYRTLNEQLEGQVEEKTRELREFFSLITHELKVPLAAIQGYTDLLLAQKGGPLTDKQRKFIESMATATTHLLALVRNMMESVKYDADKIHFLMEVFSLEELLADVQAHVLPGLEKAGVTLSIDVPPRCQQVYGDRSKLSQVFINLISNAGQVTPRDGQITVRAKDRNQAVEISVSDTGPGIAAENLPHLFDKFTQFNTPEGASSGLGLGLYIVRKIIEGHQQEIRVQSTLGSGTTFIFSLAKQEAAPATRKDDRSPSQEAEASSSLSES